ncbi:acyltransferase family protein [Cellulomonas fimi]|uniref:acyltransferase family protein n=1 Tax=Cellulomonas fimi TaxID=1708 RepID=UPI00234D4575|nr:acyltransferase [Cellulomonas fimi]MDC7122966.1 acyltransferase family protein [Cellulomonas fimi]
MSRHVEHPPAAPAGADAPTPVASAPAAAAPEPAVPAVADQPVASASRGGRFDFLDALRGIAAMAVVLQHSAEMIWPEYLRFSIGTFRLGEFGVVMFFLVSGFIIPASLEKYGSVGKFWVGRFFRLFPLYWFCVVVALVLAVMGRFYVSPEFKAAPWAWTATNATMVQQFLAGPLVIGASWSLAYEVVFYLGMSILLIVGLNKRSVPIAVSLLGLAGVAGAWIPGRLDTGHGLPGLLTVVSATVAVGLYVWFHARGGVRQAVLGVALVAVTVPLALNQPERVWFSLLLFATMTVGTVMYRLMQGVLRPWVAWGVFGGALVVVAVVHRVLVTPHVEPIAGAFVTWRPEAVTFLAAFAVFALGFLLRGRRWPRALTYLGTISYSLYLTHTIVLYATPWVSPELAETLRITPQVGTFVVWVGLTVLVSAATYAWIEKPFQRLGHRFTRRPIATGTTPEAPSQRSSGVAPASGVAATADGGVPAAAVPTGEPSVTEPAVAEPSATVARTAEPSPEDAAGADTASAPPAPVHEGAGAARD